MNDGIRQQYNEACHLARLMRRKGHWYKEYQDWWKEFPGWLQEHALAIAGHANGESDTHDRPSRP